MWRREPGTAWDEHHQTAAIIAQLAIISWAREGRVGIAEGRVMRFRRAVSLRSLTGSERRRQPGRGRIPRHERHLPTACRAPRDGGAQPPQEFCVRPVLVP